jgi:hypothetical protein
VRRIAPNPLAKNKIEPNSKNTQRLMATNPSVIACPAKEVLQRASLKIGLSNLLQLGIGLSPLKRLSDVGKLTLNGLTHGPHDGDAAHGYERDDDEVFNKTLT